MPTVLYFIRMSLGLLLLTHLLSSRQTYSDDYEAYRARYVPLGFEDPLREFEGALLRDADAWREDAELLQEELDSELRMNREKAVPDPERLRKFEEQVARFVAVSHYPEAKIHVRLYSAPYWHARVVGNDHIFVNLPTEAPMPSDEAVNWVLAHELAHIMARHGRRCLPFHEVQVEPGKFSGLLPREGRLLVATANRIFETEADLLSALYLRRAGLDLGGCVEFMQYSERKWAERETDVFGIQVRPYRSLLEEFGPLAQKYAAGRSPETYLKLMESYSQASERLGYGVVWNILSPRFPSVVNTHPVPAKRLRNSRVFLRGLDGYAPPEGERIIRYVLEAERKARHRLK